MSALTITPASPVLGARVDGIDLRAPLEPARREQIRRALFRHRVLFFADQNLSTEQFIALATALGSILVFRSVVPTDARHPEVHTVTGSTVGWHLDASSLIEPPVATLLRAVAIPDQGGDTVWADGMAAYAALPTDLKTRLAGLCATHTAPTHSPLVAHPVTPLHPEVGRRYLNINLAPWVDTRILGMPAAASAALVEEIRTHHLRSAVQLRFRWTPGAIVLWDNRGMQHTGTRDYPASVRRRLQRICLARFPR